MTTNIAEMYQQHVRARQTHMVKIFCLYWCPNIDEKKKKKRNCVLKQIITCNWIETHDTLLSKHVPDSTQNRFCLNTLGLKYYAPVTEHGLGTIFRW